jgi:hypothetical protein
LLADPERYGLKVFSKNGDTQGNGRKKPDKTGTMVPVAGEVVEGKLVGDKQSGNAKDNDNRPAQGEALGLDQ